MLPNGFAGRQPRAFFVALTTEEQVDSALAAITAYDIKCDMIVQDVNQNILCYPCSDIPVNQYATAQRRLSTALGSDSTVIDLSRIRLPGTLGFDNPDKPQLIGLLRNGAGNDWKFGGLIGRSDLQGKPLGPDRAQLETFVRALFKHATAGNRVSLRSFYQKTNKPFHIISVKLNGDLDDLINQAYHEAEQAAYSVQKVMFTPPIATFTTDDNYRAREKDLAEGLALSVECDAHCGGISETDSIARTADHGGRERWCVGQPRDRRDRTEAAHSLPIANTDPQQG